MGNVTFNFRFFLLLERQGEMHKILPTNHLKLTIIFKKISGSFPAGNYMFKVNNRNTRTRCEICSKLTIKTPERR